MKNVWTILAFSLCACTTTPATPKPLCPGVRSYDHDQLAALKTAIHSLNPSSPLLPAMYDYERMRDEARACR